MDRYAIANSELFHEVGFSECFISTWIPFLASGVRNHVVQAHANHRHWSMVKSALSKEWHEREVIRRRARSIGCRPSFVRLTEEQSRFL